MVELASPRVVYMVIQWGCLAKCQGTRKGGPNFQLVRLFERKFYQLFFFFPFFEIYWKWLIVLAWKRSGNQYAPILHRYHSTKLKCERSNALIETECRGKMVNVYSIHFCQRYRDGENTIESKWMYDRWINCATSKKKDLTGWIKRRVLFPRVGNKPIGNTGSLMTLRPASISREWGIDAHSYRSCDRCWSNCVWQPFVKAAIYTRLTATQKYRRGGGSAVSVQEKWSGGRWMNDYLRCRLFATAQSTVHEQKGTVLSNSSKAIVKTYCCSPLKKSPA